LIEGLMEELMEEFMQQSTDVQSALFHIS